jgi:hypothetical protein
MYCCQSDRASNGRVAANKYGRLSGSAEPSRPHRASMYIAAVINNIIVFIDTGFSFYQYYIHIAGVSFVSFLRKKGEGRNKLGTLHRLAGHIFRNYLAISSQVAFGTVRIDDEGSAHRPQAARETAS